MWRGVEGHDDVAEHFARLLQHNRLASTFLFVGPDGVGKRTFARQLAACLLCSNPPGVLETCDTCDSCQLRESQSHPDLVEIGLPEDKRTLSIDLMIGDRDHRHQTGLCHDISLRPFAAPRRIAIIDDADAMSNDAANCLLKTLEEPPPRSVIILISASETRQLPTIRSRCQIVRFRSLEIDCVADLLATLEPDSTQQQRRLAAERSGGSVVRARQLLDGEIVDLLESVRRQLSSPHPDPAGLATAVQVATDSAGKEASARRAFLECFWQLLSNDLQQACRQAAHSQGSTQEIELHCRLVDSTLQALEAIPRNAHLANLILWWSQQLTLSAAHT